MDSDPALDLRGARRRDVLINLSASNATIGKSDWRHALCKTHSGRCLSAYLYSAAGPGESTTDLAWDGQAMIYEVGNLLVEAPRFDEHPDIVVADIDLELIQQERMRQNTFGDCVDLHRDRLDFRSVEFTLDPPLSEDLPLERAVARYPFVPADNARLAELCFEAFNIQAHGLRQRLEATGIEKIVIGVSGGLDSTQALLVAVTAFDQLKLPRKNILAYTLPAFATTERTKGNAWRLMRALGVSAEEIDLTPALAADARSTSNIPLPAASPSMTSPSRTCRPARAPRCCSGWRTSIAASCSALVICPNWRSAGALMASAIRCRTTTSMRACRRR